MPITVTAAIRKKGEMQILRWKPTDITDNRRLWLRWRRAMERIALADLKLYVPVVTGALRRSLNVYSTDRGLYVRGEDYLIWMHRYNPFVRRVARRLAARSKINQARRAAGLR